MKIIPAVALALLLSPALYGEDSKPKENCCSILELRQYNLLPGKRDDLIALFDKYFIESQEELGMVIVGQFRDIHQPDHFVWVRGFPDMDSRAKALGKFYFESPAWKEHSAAANKTMVDVNNVLLLRPARPGSGFPMNEQQRPPLDSTIPSGRFVAATIYNFDKDFSADAFTETFEKQVMPAIKKSGAAVLSYLVTEKSKNTFPQLPVLEDANVFAWWTSFENKDAYDAYRKAEGNISVAGKSLAEFLKEQKVRSVEFLELNPTSRSLLH